MKRRSFLKIIVGVVGSAVVGPKIIDSDFLSPSSPSASISFPHGLQYLVNNDTGSFQLLSRGTYPELNAPVADAYVSSAEFENLVKIVLKGKR